MSLAGCDVPSGNLEKPMDLPSFPGSLPPSAPLGSGSESARIAPSEARTDGGFWRDRLNGELLTAELTAAHPEAGETCKVEARRSCGSLFWGDEGGSFEGEQKRQSQFCGSSHLVFGGGVLFWVALLGSWGGGGGHVVTHPYKGWVGTTVCLGWME